MNSLKPGDVIAAAAPTVSATLVAQANQIVGIIGSLLGIVYLLWRWRREARGGKI
jgi:ABC-type enterobactin transport system permease subunit